MATALSEALAKALITCWRDEIQGARLEVLYNDAGAYRLLARFLNISHTVDATVTTTQGGQLMWYARLDNAPMSAGSLAGGFFVQDTAMKFRVWGTAGSLIEGDVGQELMLTPTEGSIVAGDNINLVRYDLAIPLNPPEIVVP
jgi:hypothetical protein